MRSETSGAFWLRPQKPVGGLASKFGGMSAPGLPMRQASPTCSAALFSAACCDGGRRDVFGSTVANCSGGGGTKDAESWGRGVALRSLR